LEIAQIDVPKEKESKKLSKAEHWTK
jgi:hypothetical protein